MIELKLDALGKYHSENIGIERCSKPRKTRYSLRTQLARNIMNPDFHASAWCKALKP